MRDKGRNKLLKVAIGLMTIICLGIIYLVYVQITMPNKQVDKTEDIAVEAVADSEEPVVEEEEEWYESESDHTEESEYDETDEDYEDYDETVYEEEEYQEIDYLTLPDYLDSSAPSYLPIIRFDGVSDEFIDTGMEQGLLIQGSAFTEHEHAGGEFGEDVYVYFQVENLSEELNYTFYFQNLYVDGIYFDDDAFYNTRLHSKYYAGDTLKSGEQDTLIAEFSEGSLLRKEKFSPFPAFNESIYGEIKVVIETAGADWYDDENSDTFFVPFTMPLY